MALAEDEPVAVRPGRLVRPDAHDIEVEGRQQVGRVERAAEVARSGVVHRLDDLDPDLPRDLLEAGDLGGLDAGDRRVGHDWPFFSYEPVSYTHLRAHETPEHLVCRLLLEKKKKNTNQHHHTRT